MDYKFKPKLDYDECKALFGIEYTDLMKLRKQNMALLKDHSIPNEVYCKIVTLDAALEGVYNLFN